MTAETEREAIVRPVVLGNSGAAQTILPPRNCDPEVAGIMDELSKLQTWLVLQGARPDGRLQMAAADLVQRTRCLIVERCFKTSALPQSQRAGE